MLLVTSNKTKQLLHARFIGPVLPEELQRARADFTAELAGLSPGFHYLADYSQFESMNLDDTPKFGRLMELIGQSGVGLVVRVIPDASHDIGVNIMTIFHYPPELKIITCKTLAEAATALALWENK
jgi:hypothetical protein